MVMVVMVVVVVMVVMVVMVVVEMADNSCQSCLTLALLSKYRVHTNISGSVYKRISDQIQISVNLFVSEYFKLCHKIVH